MNMPLFPPCPALAVVAACLALPAQAALPDTAVARALALAREAAQAVAPAGARVEAQAGTLDPRLRLAPCTQVQAFLPAGVAPWGRTRVGLRCAQGPVAWQVHLPVTVQVWAPAVVATGPLPAGTALDGTQLQLAATDWAAAPQRPHARVEELEGRVLARPLHAGQAVRGTDLRPRQWFAQGETVQIVALGRGFAVSAEGQALAPGLEGQPVRVRTESGRVVVAVPVAQRRVELAL